MNTNIYVVDGGGLNIATLLMQYLITHQQLGEKNILFPSRTKKLINLQLTAKAKEQKSTYWWKSGIPVGKFYDVNWKSISKMQKHCLDYNFT